MRRFSKLTAIFIAIVIISHLRYRFSSQLSPPAPTYTKPLLVAENQGRRALTNMGRGDRSFNDVTLSGLDRAVQDFGIEYKDVTPKENAQFANTLTYFASNGYDLIIAISFGYTDDIVKVSAQYPDSKFIAIDCAYDEVPSNVLSVVFNEQESAYLAGVIAAMMSKTGSIGFVGGMDAPLINKFEGGYIAGALATKPDIDLQVAYIGTAPRFNNPAKAKK